MKLTILIPVFNEEKTIAQVLTQIVGTKIDCEKEIIVIDDGSTDKTKFMIKKIQSQHKKIKLVSHPTNLGKGKAIITGVKKATGDYILIQDADLEYNPVEIPKLLNPIFDSGRNHTNSVREIAIYGSRFKNRRPVIPVLYFIGNKLLTILTNILYGTKLTDMETGYKLLPASFCQKIKFSSAHFDIEPEITAKLIKNGIKIIEVPISYHGRTHLAGKKLTIIDAFEAIKALIILRFRTK